MEFNDSMNYLEFWELGVESVGSHIEPESSSIRKRSPDIFTDSSSEEEETDLYPKQAAILNQLHEMMKVEQDVVNIFIMDSIRKLLTTRSSSTSRDLFYKCPLNITINKFYRKLHRIFNSLAVLPTDLRIFSSAKGLVSGNLKITLEKGEIIQCLASVATTIPNQLGNVCVETSADAVIIVEKDTVFQKLIDHQIFDKIQNMILITGKGYPDVSTRLLLKKIVMRKDIKVYCLVDGDPYGIHIMTVYRYGSKALDRVKERISCPEVRWIGIMPSEMKKLNLPMAPLTEFDQTTLKNLLENENLNHTIKKELEIQKTLDAKTEIEYLSLPPFNYNLADYIAEKIKHNLCI